MLININNLSIKRQGKKILDNINLKIDKSDFTTIIGPNGAGKSMLVKAIIGAVNANSGSIKKAPNLKIGYLPQKFNIDSYLPISAKRFLSLGFLSPKSSILDLDNIINECNIAKIIDKQIKVMSGGELQRVLLAFSLLNNPDLLILDEPVQNLDISGQLEFYKLLNKIYQKRKLSILMISHDLHMVMASTTKVICLYNKICCHGKADIIANDPEFKSIFGHDMSEMMAIYQHSHNKK